MLLCMGASDHTRDPSPGASRQTFRCAGGTPILIGLSSQIGRLAAHPPHPPAMNRMQISTKCTNKRHGPIFRHKMRWMQGGVPEGPQDAATLPTQNARAWEEAARPQGLFPSYACRNGRGARDLHAIAYGNTCEKTMSRCLYLISFSLFSISQNGS